MLMQLCRELVDGYIEASQEPKRQFLILTMLARHYSEKQVKQLLPGVTSKRYQKASDRKIIISPNIYIRSPSRDPSSNCHFMEIGNLVPKFHEMAITTVGSGAVPNMP